ncbi:MAG: trypsin-like peptidase domain-containing protein [Gemmatimonadales bacterium]
MRVTALVALLLGAAAPSATAQGAPAARSASSSRRTALVDAAARVSPSVVSISVQSHQRANVQSPFDMFFIPQTAERAVTTYGTGFVIRPGGYIVTNQHVVANAESITVTLPDGTDLPATLIGADPLSDIAVVKIDRSDLPIPTMGGTTDLMIGEWAIALGNPFNFLLGNAEPTVTAGVISATGRNILPQGDETGLYLDMIQTDAAINHGNSGGPLANALGQVIGVNSSIFTSSGGSIGLGFAIPIERALRVADELIHSGVVRRPWVGLDVAGAESMRDWKTQGGVSVTRVAPGGPAALAGIVAGDVLATANGRRLRNFLDWESVNLDVAVGDTIVVTLRKGGVQVTRKLVAADLPTMTATRVTVLKGLELVTMTPSIRSEKGIKSEQGALIVRIADAVAQATGMQQGDVIVAIDRTPVTEAEQVGTLLKAMHPRDSMRFYLERGGRVVYTDLAFQ